MSKNNKGFSSLISLVSEIDSDDQFKEKIGTAVTTSTEDIITEPMTNGVAPATSVDSPSKSKKTPEKPESSLFRNFVALLMVIGGLIWWFDIDIKGALSTQTYNQKPAPTQNISTSKPEELTEPEKIAPFTKPNSGKNRILSIGEIKWCLREKSQIQAKRGLYKNKIVSDSNRSKFNTLVKSYNSRCGEYKYKGSNYEISVRQVKEDIKTIDQRVSAKKVVNKEVKQKKKIPKALIKDVQKLLSQLGYKPGIADGKYGRKTGAAIKQFQQKAGLVVDGKVSDKLLLLLQKQLQFNKGVERKTKENDIKKVSITNTDKVAAEKLAAKKAEYHRKWRENQKKKEQNKIKQILPTDKKANESNQVLNAQKRANLEKCIKYAGSPSLCKQHLLTQGQKTQVLNAQKHANLKKCIEYAGSPSLCKQHLLTQGQKTQVLNAQKHANLKKCIEYAGSPSLCKQHLLTQGQKTQVLNAQKHANLKKCLEYAGSPSLCKQHLLTSGQKAQVLNAQRLAN